MFSKAHAKYFLMLVFSVPGECEALHPPPRHHLLRQEQRRGLLHPPDLQPRHRLPRPRAQLQVRLRGDGRDAPAAVEHSDPEAG